LFEKDIKEREGELNRRMRLDLLQHQFDAVFILCFNIGIGGFLESNIYKFLQQQDNEAAFSYWRKWKKAKDPKTGKLEVSPGLVNRRAREINLFCNDLKDINDYKAYEDTNNG
jgi:GH24 family phage-related lysozyme (muramidase)